MFIKNISYYGKKILRGKQIENRVRKIDRKSEKENSIDRESKSIRERNRKNRAKNLKKGLTKCLLF